MSFNYFPESILETLRSTGERRPKINTGFAEKGFMIAVEAPGVTKETLKLTVQGDSLLFTGKPVKLVA
jgi:HSP20 family molecular chaperone IbpA